MLGVEDIYVRAAGSRSVTTTPVALLGPLLVAVTVKVTLVFRFGVALSTDLVIAMSAATGVTVALNESLAPLGSNSVSAVLVAVFVVGAVVFTVATIKRVALEALAIGPMFQTPVPALSVAPTAGVAETKVRPAGSRSVTWTPFAALGPLFVAVTVKVTFVPRSGVALFTTLVIAMSASALGVMVAVAELLPATGSGWNSAVLVAVFVAGAVVLTVATIARVADEPLLSAPMSQRPVPEL